LTERRSAVCEITGRTAKIVQFSGKIFHFRADACERTQAHGQTALKQYLLCHRANVPCANRFIINEQVTARLSIPFRASIITVCVTDSVLTRSIGSSNRTHNELCNFSCSSTFTERTTPRSRRATSLRQIIFVLTSSAQNKAMPPINFLAVIAWLVIMTLSGIEAHRQRMKLMTRPSDGAALCAKDPPTLSTKMSPAMPEAPGVVRCGMACTNDGGCKHFNYVPNESDRCQLYHYRPTTFEVRPHCHHYYEPGQENIIIFIFIYHNDSKKT